MTEINGGGITLITFTDRIAEIVINPTMKPVSAAELTRLLIANDVFAAKIIRIQTAKKSRQPRFEPRRWRAVTP
jgi:hypothetical protein